MISRPWIQRRDYVNIMPIAMSGFSGSYCCDVAWLQCCNELLCKDYDFCYSTGWPLLGWLISTLNKELIVINTSTASVSCSHMFHVWITGYFLDLILQGFSKAVWDLPSTVRSVAELNRMKHMAGADVQVLYQHNKVYLDFIFIFKFSCLLVGYSVHFLQCVC